MKTVPLIELLKNRYPDIPPKDHYARIMCGEVFVGDECIRDPKRRVAIHSPTEFVEKRYVSRGGTKLEVALREWNPPVRDRVFIDAGASTGGFTDCLLQHGAALVHAVDVGYNQLDYRLRNEPRVRVHERTNIMSVTAFDPPPHAAVADLSFRTIRKAAAHILSMTVDRWMIALVKPQFELDPVEEKEFTGVVRSSKTMEKVLQQVCEGLQEETIRIDGILPSPITGRKGNQEFLFYLSKKNRDSDVQSAFNTGSRNKMIRAAMEKIGRIRT
jgi:23S rRNA (cytidine1920-2'-O)/16S rRNA (cytidine1409-2'-O)-methyltransferase